jgi:predicted nucleic acid-binding protein
VTGRRSGTGGGEPRSGAAVLPELVLDASVVVKWFKTAGEAHVEAAQRLRERYREGQFAVVVPGLLYLELLNAAARRWGWTAEELAALAYGLPALDFRVHEPALEGIATWCARGLTAYDACYLAVAEERRTVVVTTDDLILSAGGASAQPLHAV